MKKMNIVLILLVMALNAFAIEPANNKESKSVIELLDDDDDKEAFDWVKVPTVEDLYKVPERDVITERDERIIDKTRTVVEKFLDKILKIFDGEDDNQKE